MINKTVSKETAPAFSIQPSAKKQKNKMNEKTKVVSDMWQKARKK